MWPIPDTLFDTLHHYFNIKRVIGCNPFNLPLRAKVYIPHDPLDSTFGAMPHTRSAWPDTSLALQDYTANKLTRALEQALYSAHAPRHTHPSTHILILPNWKHTS